MKLPTHKVYTPEWCPSDSVIFYYDKTDGAWSLDAKSKRLIIPAWLNKMIDKVRDEAYSEGSRDARKQVRDLITQLKNI